MDKNAKIYVAGHQGLMGSAIVRQLQSQGYRNLLLKTRGELDLLEQNASFDFLLAEKPEYVFVAAAKVGGIAANMKSLGSFLFENLQIQNNIIEGSRKAKVRKLLFLGASCIYPKQSVYPIAEDQLMNGPLEPTNEGYAIAKIAGIRLCQFYKQQYACDFISAIPTSLYGINDNYDPENSHLLAALIRKVHEAKIGHKKSITLWGSGKPRREFILSDDCAAGLVFLMNNYSGQDPINIGVGEDQSILEIAQTVAKVLKVDLEIELDSSKPDGMMRKVLNVERMKNLGWSPRISLEEGIAIAYEDFRKKYGQ